MPSTLLRAARRLLLPPPGTRLVPPAGTLALCALTAAAFAGQTLAGDWRCAAGALYNSPSELLPVTRVGGGQAVPVWATLFTYQFLHAGWWHLASNLVVVWCAGTLAEPAWGTARFLAAYLASGAAGAVGTGVVVPHSPEPLVGASLAYCGVLGAYTAQRLSGRLRGWWQAPVVAAEAAAVVLVAWWLGGREHRAAWEGPVVYHLLPFMAAWLVARAWYGLARLRRAR